MKWPQAEYIFKIPYLVVSPKLIDTTRLVIVYIQSLLNTVNNVMKYNFSIYTELSLQFCRL